MMYYVFDTFRYFRLNLAYRFVHIIIYHKQFTTGTIFISFVFVSSRKTECNTQVILLLKRNMTIGTEGLQKI